MCHSEVCDPDARACDHLLVHTVLVVFLLVSVQEKVQTGEVAERDELGERRPLLVPQRLEELVVEVAYLFLRDRRQRVDRVKPSV